MLMCTRGLARQALRGHAADVIMTLCRRIADVRSLIGLGQDLIELNHCHTRSAAVAAAVDAPCMHEGVCDW